MSEVSIDKIKLLRVKTGIGLIGCKNALLEADGNIEKAIVCLRKKGLAVALNKMSRKALSGLIFLLIDDNRKNGVILEVNCETDFVAKSSEFITYVRNLAETFLYSDVFNKDFYMLHDDICINKDIEKDRMISISKFGENIIIRRVRRFGVIDGCLFGYVHGLSNFGKVGSILLADNKAKSFDNMVVDIAMQVVAMNPLYLRKEDVPENVKSNERKIYLETAKNKYSDKSEVVIDKMINGQMDKFYKNIVLYEQLFIKDAKYSVKNLICNKFSLLDFVRFEVGEDI